MTLQIATLALVAMQMLLIATLLWVGRQRRSALRALADEHARLDRQVCERSSQLQQVRVMLRESEARFRSYFDLPFIGSAITSPDKGWLEVNEGLCTMLGYSAPELAELTWADLTHPGDIDADLAQFERVLAGEIETYALEKRFVRKDGGVIWTHVSVGCVRRADRRVEYMVDLVQDITQRKQAEAAMAQARELAETANAQKGQFLANMSHEIRTPLNAMIGLTQLLMDTRLDARQRDSLNKIYASSKALLRILNDILDYSKIESGRIELEQTDFRPGDLLKGVVDLCAASAEEKGLALEVQVAPEVPPILRGDPLRLGQVLHNLVGNAVKFTRQGSIRVRCGLVRRGKRRVRLAFTVADTGIGIAPEQVPRLFQPFSQADGSITRNFGGTGLGLAISKRIAESMGGGVGVQSTPGEGSTFRVTVRLGIGSDTGPRPAAEVAGPRSPLTGLWFQTGPIRGARVLLVEDDLVSQQVARGFLRKAGLSVDVVGDGRAACEGVARTDYDLVLMDLQMPVMDGLAATRCIRAAAGLRQPPIVAMTASAMRQDRTAALAAGMNDHIAKPIDRDELLAVLLRWIPAGDRSAPLAAAPPGDPPAAGSVEGEGEAPGPRVAGLDLAGLIRRLGGTGGAVPQILVCFAEDFRDAAGTLEALVGAGDPVAAMHLAHRLKGSAGNIGAAGLLAAAKALELELAQGEHGSLARLVAELTAVLAGIDGLAAGRSPGQTGGQTGEQTEGQAEPPAGPLDTGRVAAGLHRLAMLLGAYRVVPETLVTELKGLLAGRVSAGTLEALARQVERFDYAAATATMRDIAARLAIPL